MGAVAGEELMQAPSGLDERILVSVRVRPLNVKETARNDVSDWECINDTTIIYRNSLSVSERSMYPTAYTFDRVFSPDCSSRQVYKEGAREVALSVVSGINSSVFAYGQTSSGKTYTMSGITEYAIADIYDYIDKHKEREFVLKFSAMEIYNESVRDLLSADSSPLRLLDDPEKGTIVEKLTEETLRDWNHFKELLSICEAQRQIGETLLNETSSRSHQILRVSIESSALEFLSNDKSSMLAATVNFVDLAGSERASQSLSAGTRLKEGCHINRSLLTLGTVVRKLSKGRNGHVPFRDSKLTRILQSSLGGNARTAIICTMSPARSHVEQSRNTLLFASCAKEVTTNAQVNVVVTDKALVKQLQKELARLESELKSSRPTSTTSDLAAKLQEKDLQIEKLEKDVMELTRQRDLAHAHVEDLLQAAEDDEPSIVLQEDHRYPKLRVRSSRKFDNSMLELPIYVNPRCLDGSVGSFDASQYSDGHSSRSDDSFIQLPEFEGNFQHINCSPQLSISVSNYGENDQHGEDIEEPTYEISEHHCKEVRCVEIQETNHNKYNILESNKNMRVDSNTASPARTIATSGLTVLENEGTADEKIGSLKCKDQKLLNRIRPLVLESLEKPCPYMLDKDNLYTSILKLTRSRSCKARLMSNMSSRWFEKTDSNESTPQNLVEKDFTGRPQNYERKLVALQFDFNTEGLSSNASQNSVRSTSVDEHQMKDVEMVDAEEKARLCNIDAGPKEVSDVQDERQLGDHLVQETEPKTIVPDERNVKDVGLEPVQNDVGSPSEMKRLPKDARDVGLDPIQDESRSPLEWPSEFKRLQREIIELWHACNISLVHRTFFFLLFKGEPTDSTYMELELRMLSSLKETYFKENNALDDGQTPTLASSMRALRQERQTLSKQMHRRLSREERENLFLKWGIKLNSNHRTLQLSHRLWTNTTDMKHITESATIVAKVVGFVQPGKAFTDIAGLNFAQESTTRKYSIWMRNLMKPKLMKRSMMSLL
ncbi:kinesin-like protein KIN-7H isoform X1 [Tripterygium wilfordii]|uniref:kinesin-like protein KIN-7H isoform X1 n=1 Tax=Tripterygium wilfordii TaxID=458696 RepID=UPI0018F83ACD|nr:kinesin-like protein KIN-7H isoform X1 [Tripterygium wilfordii]XP_038723460.1 kinesin-like protein KIN-7H isoform X1 [Tripterygium wilfordii]XP_038723461.1 kinesin-like protein KIN-7H isoform X1 [Tripterygium wilfordii]